MIKGKGRFSDCYLPRRGKENNLDENNHNSRNTQEVDLPLAYNSYKTLKERSVSVKKRPTEEQLGLKEQVTRLEKELRQTKESSKKMAREHSSKNKLMQMKVSKMEKELKDKQDTIEQQRIMIQQMVKQMKEQNESGQIRQKREQNKRYKQTIKQQILWMMGLFLKTESKALTSQKLSSEIRNCFTDLQGYIKEFNITQQLQQLASGSLSSIAHQTNHSSSIFHINTHAESRPLDSMFTQDLEEAGMIKVTQPLIQTFSNLQCFEPQASSTQKMERITRKLFEDSPLSSVHQHHSVLELWDQQKPIKTQPVLVQQEQENQFLPKGEQEQKKDFSLPLEVFIVADYIPGVTDENFIVLERGKKLKLLRKIRDGLWIGEVEERIGLVQQQHFILP